MDFTHNATFPASVDEVITTSTSESFLSGLSIADTAAPVVRESSDDGTTAKSETFWEYTGQLDAMAKTLLGNKPLTWVQTVTIDKASKTGKLEIVYMEGKIPGTCEADVTFTDNGDGTTTRDIKGSIVVKIMMVGPTVEKRLVEGIDARLDAEAKALTAALS